MRCAGAIALMRSNPPPIDNTIFRDWPPNALMASLQNSTCGKSPVVTEISIVFWPFSLKFQGSKIRYLPSGINPMNLKCLPKCSGRF